MRWRNCLYRKRRKILVEPRTLVNLLEWLVTWCWWVEMREWARKTDITIPFTLVRFPSGKKWFPISAAVFNAKDEGEGEGFFWKCHNWIGAPSMGGCRLIVQRKPFDTEQWSDSRPRPYFLNSLLSRINGDDTVRIRYGCNREAAFTRKWLFFLSSACETDYFTSYCSRYDPNSCGV